jgi:hypothetical protein
MCVPAATPAPRAPVVHRPPSLAADACGQSRSKAGRTSPLSPAAAREIEKLDAYAAKDGPAGQEIRVRLVMGIAPPEQP